MKKKLIILSGILMLVAGCQIPVPANEAKFGDMSFKFPKDVEITGLTVTKTGAKSFVLKADSWKSQNSPPVIAASAAGGAQLIEATGNALAKNSEAIVAGFVKGAKP